MKTIHVEVLDFKKAFDKVPHALLMQKLKLIQEIHPQLLNWIQYFLRHGQQKVVNEEKNFLRVGSDSGAS